MNSDELLHALDRMGVPGASAEALADAYPAGRGIANATAAMLASAAGSSRTRPPAWARRIPAAFALAAAAGLSARERHGTRVLKPEVAAAHVRAVIAGHDDAECFVVLYLNAQQRVIDARLVARGSVAEVDAHPREVFRPGVQCGAHSVVIAHNHPSGDPEPSEADIRLTVRLGEVGAMLGVPVLDHIVIGSGTSFSSLAQLGLGGL